MRKDSTKEEIFQCQNKVHFQKLLFGRLGQDTGFQIKGKIIGIPLDKLIFLSYDNIIRHFGDFHMKKVMTFLLTVLLTGFTSAQNAEFKKLLATGREYEKKGEYVYALGYYYDAMQSDLKNAHEALDAFQKITNALQEGRPGLKNSYTKNALHTEYVSLLKNADKYWTEFFSDAYTYRAHISGIDSRKNNSTGTGVYVAHVRIEGMSAKYNDIMTPLLKGLRMKWTGNWVEIPGTWPAQPLTYEPEDTYENTGVLFYTDFDNMQPVEMRTNRTTKQNEYTALYDKRYTVWNFGGFPESESDELKTMIQLELAINNKDTGDELISSKKTLIKNFGTKSEDDHYYNNVEIMDVPKDVMQIIDEGKASVSIKHIYLKHGKPTLEDLIEYTKNKTQKTSDHTEFAKSLAESDYNEMNPSRAGKALVFNTQSQAEEYYYQESIPHQIHALNANYGWIRISDKNLNVDAEIWSTKVTQKEYEALMGKNPNSENRDMKKHIGANKPVGYINANMAIDYCNKKSIRDNLEPCYELNENGLWICNMHATGYRLITLQEECAAFGSTDNFWQKDDNTDTYEIHDVACLDPNNFGLYDFVGNGAELKFFVDDRGKCYAFTNPRLTFSFETREYYEEAPEQDQIPKTRKDLVPVKKDNAEPSEHFMSFRIAKSTKESIAAYKSKMEKRLASIGWIHVKNDEYNVDAEIWATKVTQKEYESIMGENPNKKKNHAVKERHPATFISAPMAIEYCNKKSKSENLEPCYTLIMDENDKQVWRCNMYATGYRLPTPQEAMIAFGEPKTKDYDEFGFYDDFWPTDSELAEVAMKEPNSLGFYDIFGNGTEMNMTVFEELCYNETHYNPFLKNKIKVPEARKTDYEDDSELKLITIKKDYASETSSFRIARTTKEAIAKDKARCKMQKPTSCKNEIVQFMDKEIIINAEGQNLNGQDVVLKYNGADYTLSDISDDKTKAAFKIPLPDDFYKNEQYNGDLTYFVSGKKRNYYIENNKRHKIEGNINRILIKADKIDFSSADTDISKKNFKLTVTSPTSAEIEKYGIPVTVKENGNQIEVQEDSKTSLSKTIAVPKGKGTYTYSVEFNGTEVIKSDFTVTDKKTELENAFKDIAEPVEFCSDGEKSAYLFNVPSDKLYLYSPKKIKEGTELKFIKTMKANLKDTLKKETHGISEDMLKNAVIKHAGSMDFFKTATELIPDGKKTLKDIYRLSGKDSMFVFTIEF